MDKPARQSRRTYYCWIIQSRNRIMFCCDSLQMTFAGLPLKFVLRQRQTRGCGAWHRDRWGALLLQINRVLWARISTTIATFCG